MFGAIAWGALWCPLGVVQFLVCTKWVIRWNSKNVQKRLKINGSEHFQRTHFGRPIWARSVPMQRGARFQLFRSVPMQRGVHSGALPCSAALIFFGKGNPGRNLGGCSGESFGDPRPPRRHPEGCARGAPTSFRIRLSSPFCCLRCEPMRSTITINTYTKKNK